MVKKFPSVLVNVYEKNSRHEIPVKAFLIPCETLKNSLIQAYSEFELNITDFRKYQKPEKGIYSKSAYVSNRIFLDTGKFFYMAQG